MRVLICLYDNKKGRIVMFCFRELRCRRMFMAEQRDGKKCRFKDLSQQIWGQS